MARVQRSTQTIVGQRKYPKCNGTVIESAVGSQAIAVGPVKSDVVKSDGVLPTPYSCLWVNRYETGQYTARQNGDLCGPSGNMYFTVVTSKLPLGAQLLSLPGFNASYYDGIWQQSPASAYWEVKGIHNTVTMAILKKIGDQKLSLGVTAGEAKETVNLVLDLVEDLISCVKFVKHGIRKPGEFIHYMTTKPKGRPNLNGRPHWPEYAKMNDDFAKRSRKLGIPDNRRFSSRELKILGVTTQAAANRWLQYRYGIIPAYNDLIKIFDDLIAKSDEPQTYSARVTIPLGDLGPAGHNSNNYRTNEGKGEGFQQVKVWFNATNPQVRSLAQRGLDITSLPSIAWELTPFSFMVDWFYPVGDSLEALSATRGLSFAYGYKSQKYEVKDGKSHWAVSSEGGTKYQFFRDNAAKLAYGAFQRVPITSFPLVRFPEVENPFGVHTGQRITDVLAIGKQLFSSKRTYNYT